MKVLCKNTSFHISSLWVSGLTSCAFFIFDQNNVFCMRTIFKIVQKTFPCLEMAKKGFAFILRLRRLWRKQGLSSIMHGIRKSSSDLGAKSQCVSEVETAPGKGLWRTVWRGTHYSQEETQDYSKGTFLYTKEWSLPPVRVLYLIAETQRTTRKVIPGTSGCRRVTLAKMPVGRWNVSLLRTCE